MNTIRIHGGSDEQGHVPWDFSTNSNACGPCPTAMAAVQQAEFTRYPDPAYTQLRAVLADFHQVQFNRIVLAASASEAIQRLTAWQAQIGVKTIAVPVPAYGDYAAAAQAWAMRVWDASDTGHEAPCLRWFCDPASPTGLNVLPPTQWPAGTVVLDRAYHPLRLSGECAWSPEALDATWQLWSPNKALGLTGVRGAYLIAPQEAEEAVEKLSCLAPSWPLGAHGVAMLEAWVQPSVQNWITSSRGVLSEWQARQTEWLQSLGWRFLSSHAPFACGQPPEPLNLPLLRAWGIKLRDTTSMGLPGHYRLSAQPPATQDRLMHALQRLSTLNAAQEGCSHHG